MGDFLEKVGLPSSLYNLQWACKVVNGKVNHPHLCRYVVCEESKVCKIAASLMMYGRKHATAVHWILTKKNVVVIMAREEPSGRANESSEGSEDSELEVEESYNQLFSFLEEDDADDSQPFGAYLVL